MNKKKQNQEQEQEQGQRQGQKQRKQYPFVDLTNDRAFKAFFSNNKELLLSLLKAFLPLPQNKNIHSFDFIETKKKEQKQPVSDKKQSRQQTPQKRSSLILTDTSLYSPSVGDKQVVLDLNVQLNTGEKVNVEMHRRVGGDTGCFSILPIMLTCKGRYFIGPGCSPRA